MTYRGKPSLSSFDHKQKYGLPARIDAKEGLIRLLSGQICLGIRLDKETVDLILSFAEATKLQVFGFIGYEVWDILFSDSTGEYSNYAVP